VDEKPRLLSVIDCGTLEFDRALELQESLVSRTLAGDSTDYLLLLTHPPVVTLGRSATAVDEAMAEALSERGIAVRRIRRGGRATYHSPGQIVGYPIVALEPVRRDLHAYLRALEGAIVDALGAFGIDGHGVEEKTGVWVDGSKVASIGVCVRSWVTYHGFSLNLTEEGLPPAGMDPCGLKPTEMGSLEGLGRSVARDELQCKLGHAVAARLSRNARFGQLEELLTNSVKSGMMV